MMQTQQHNYLNKVSQLEVKLIKFLFEDVYFFKTILAVTLPQI